MCWFIFDLPVQNRALGLALTVGKSEFSGTSEIIKCYLSWPCH